jgi:type IV pilus assembly protein PilA
MEKEEGFTLIELLVVILIIGILAAIAIPSFLNQRYKGQDACAKSMVKQMQTAIKTYQTDNNSYSGATLAKLTEIETSITGTTAQGNCQPLGVGSAVSAAGAGSCNTTNPTSTDFCVYAASLSNNTFAISETGTGGVVRTCTIPQNGNAGGCKGTASSTAAANGSW